MVDWKCQLLLLCERLVAHLTQSSFDYVYFIKIEVALHILLQVKKHQEILQAYTQAVALGRMLISTKIQE